MAVFCAAVDWGTTRLRLWLVDEAGRAVATRRSDDGMASTPRERFAPILEGHLAAMGAGRELPAVVCGMAGARQGWLEVPYLDTPAPLADIAGRAARVPDAPREVRLLPGIAQRRADAPDVMRGEETQLLGLAGDSGARALVCLPGTHSKWATVEDGAVTAFRTFMTGELFAAVGRHTVLSHMMDAAGEAPADMAGAAFDAAVVRILADPGGLTAALFSIRAGDLLGFSAAGEAGRTLSGLLVGAEIAAAGAAFGAAEPVTLVASGPLGDLYARALAIAARDAVRKEAEDVVLAGLVRAARTIWGGRAKERDHG